MRRDPALREDVLSSDLILADGIAVVWAGRLLGRRLPERVAGIDLMHGMLRRGSHARLARLLPGRDAGGPRRRARAHGGGLPGACRSPAAGDGYFKDAEEQAVAADIAAARADILLVAMTSPEEGEVPGPLERDARAFPCATASAAPST